MTVRPIIGIITVLLFCHCNQLHSQKGSLNNQSDTCKCIEAAFSVQGVEPLAHSYIESMRVAFCGQQNWDWETGEYIPLSEKGFALSGYNIISCLGDSSIFSAGEYYTDSVSLLDDSFRLFRTSSFPTEVENEWETIPILEYIFRLVDQKIVVDTYVAVPEKFMDPEFLDKLKKLTNSFKNDSIYPTKYPDYMMHYLLLKALSDESFEKDFLESGPYDGYMGPMFRDYKEMLGYREKRIAVE